MLLCILDTGRVYWLRCGLDGLNLSRNLGACHSSKLITRIVRAFQLGRHQISLILNTTSGRIVPSAHSTRRYSPMLNHCHHLQRSRSIPVALLRPFNPCLYHDSPMPQHSRSAIAMIAEILDTTSPVRSDTLLQADGRNAALCTGRSPQHFASASQLLYQ